MSSSYLQRVFSFVTYYLYFQLFGADDPMAFGLPVNPELNPHSEKEDDDHNGEASNYPSSTSPSIIILNYLLVSSNILKTMF